MVWTYGCHFRENASSRSDAAFRRITIHVDERVNDCPRTVPSLSHDRNNLSHIRTTRPSEVGPNPESPGRRRTAPDKARRTNGSARTMRSSSLAVANATAASADDSGDDCGLRNNCSAWRHAASTAHTAITSANAAGVRGTEDAVDGSASCCSTVTRAATRIKRRASAPTTQRGRTSQPEKAGGKSNSTGSHAKMRARSERARFSTSG